MPQAKLFDVVRLTVDLPADKLRTGEIGTIVLVFDQPNEAYEVEFTDDEGHTLALTALTFNQFEVIESPVVTDTPA